MAGGPTPQRRETSAERDDRNWAELLQELRVTQTGVQLLTGFLLTLPFQSRFAKLDDLERAVYLVAVTAAVLATGFLIAPVSMHRILFREGQKKWLVTRGNRAARTGLGCLAVAMTAVVWLVFDIVVGKTAGFVTAVAAGALFATLWWVAPALRRRGAGG